MIGFFFTVDKWRKENKLPNFGMPPFLGSGSHEYNGEKYRFIVMERYGTDLWKLFLENERTFPEHTVYKVAWQIVTRLKVYLLYFSCNNIDFTQHLIFSR